MTTITIDIETLPDLTPGARDKYIEAARENVKVPSGATKETLAADLGITDKEEIKFTARTTLDARWIAEVGPSQAEPAGDAEWRKTSFSGLAGQLLMIGIAIDDEAPFVLYGDEPLILDGFKHVLADVQKSANMGLPVFVGHNLIDFDLPFIFHRSVMLGVAPHITFPVAPSRYSERIYDTMVKWAGFGNRVKLDTLAQALGVGGKGDIDGSMVYDYYAAGRVDELVEYCKNDVAMTRAVYQRMTFQQLPLAA
jgi:hypothetical protein